MKTLLACAVAAVTMVALSPTQLSAQQTPQDLLNTVIQSKQSNGDSILIGDQFEKQMQQGNQRPLQNKQQPVQTAPNNQINSMSRNVK
jgi:hypothetical protein